MITFPKKRSSFLLIALLGANVVLYVWFASRTRETSADEIIQKAYIISRLVSDAASRSIILDDPQVLKSAVAEAFKDRHIVSVTVVDDTEKILFESATTRTAVNPNTFRTPVKLGKKREGTLITAFSINDEDKRISSRLHTTALIQLGLLAAVAVLLTLPARKLTRAASDAVVADQHETTPQALCSCLPTAIDTDFEEAPLPTGEPVDTVLPLLNFSLEQPADKRSVQLGIALQEQPAPSPPPPESPVNELFSACRTLQQAAQLLANEASLQHRKRLDSNEYVAQICGWQQQTLQTAVRVEQLVATGEEIVTQVRDLSAAHEANSREWPATLQLHLKSLLETIAGIECAAELMAARDRGEREPTSIEALSTGNAVATADVLLEGAAIMRERAIPSVAATLADVDQVGYRLDALQTLLNECGDRSIAIGRTAAELGDLAEALRLLRRTTQADGGLTTAEDEIRRQHLATRLETIAAELKQESRELLGITNEANALGRAADAECTAAQQHLLRAGTAVEDAATTAVLGSSYLRLFNDEGVTDASLADLYQLLRSLRTQLAEQVQLLASPAINDDRQTVECAHSLAVACDTLRLAGKFLVEMTATTFSMAGKREHDQTGVPADTTVTVEKLISEACVRLVQHLPPADRRG